MSGNGRQVMSATGYSWLWDAWWRGENLSICYVVQYNVRKAGVVLSATEMMRGGLKLSPERFSVTKIILEKRKNCCIKNWKKIQIFFKGGCELSAVTSVVIQAVLRPNISTQWSKAKGEGIL